jgi:topoisomerase-4 subunit B
MPPPAKSAAAQASLFDDALNPAPAAPLAETHEPRAGGSKAGGYSAKDIEVLEGLEPVRKRPGMYIGGTDERSLHHLFAEVLDNAMDEAVAGHAKVITVKLDAEGALTVVDDGRGIPVDPHPKHPGKSALEVIMTVLHSGGKFSGKAYETSGGLHGVGVSVVNALSERVEVTAWKDGFEWRQAFTRGKPIGGIEKLGPTRKHGTAISFTPDPVIFGENVAFKPARLYRMARSKAYLFGGVEIRWSCDASRIHDQTPPEAVFRFPNGLADFLAERIKDIETVTPEPFAGRYERQGEAGKVEWAIAWTPAGFGDADGFLQSYCNTVPTPEGGTHEAGLRAALTRGLKAYAELTGEKRGSIITADDVIAQAGALVSVFIRDPEFQGQTKEKLSSSEAQRLVETALRDPFDHWLAAQPKSASALLEFVVERAEERLKRRRDKEVARASATRKLRLPGKLADCSAGAIDGAEIFLVEGDSAGGSAKQARDRKTQAILPLRGKILNVASASLDKLGQNKELTDLLLALGVQGGSKFKEEDLRYERVVIMTDADVDGAHIASLLITFFYRTMPDLIRAGRLYLALPPLYRLSHGGKSMYARDDTHRDELLATEFKGKKPEISRFKGLGEMMPAQLKETTMDPSKRTLARVTLPRAEETVESLVEALMGRKPELRFQFIQENAEFAQADLDV